MAEQELTIRKSILDGIPVVDKAFPLNKECSSKIWDGGRFLSVVGSCPSCGGPVYGLSTVAEDEEKPPVKYSCDCFRRQGVVQQKFEHECK